VEATRKGSDGGFTLIELMIVIVVLGLVAATVLFAAGGVSDRGTASVCQTNLKQVESAEAAYFSQFNSYTTIPDLVTRRLLRQAPSSSDYSFAVDLATGEVTSTPPCSSL
jgi:general secretion pathway protein G